jgi:tetratricopeptide (TPR) repeat protein
MPNWNTYKEDAVLFVEAGFVSVNMADEDTALKLFKAAELVAPDMLLPKIGYGYLHLHKLELKQACKAFEEVLEKEPENEMAKTFLGLCLGLSTTTIDKGEKLLMQMARSKDPMIARLSDTAISFCEKYVKKNPGPASPEHHKK